MMILPNKIQLFITPINNKLQQNIIGILLIFEL